jgi:hypothetical protein
VLLGYVGEVALCLGDFNIVLPIINGEISTQINGLRWEQSALGFRIIYQGKTIANLGLATALHKFLDFDERADLYI